MDSLVGAVDTRLVEAWLGLAVDNQAAVGAYKEVVVALDMIPDPAAGKGAVRLRR